MKSQKILVNESRKNSVSGITLIALVVTIIVLLILAGISIMMLTGNNGILQRAGDAKEKTEVNGIIEQAKTDILGQIAENKGENISKDQLKAILSNYFEDFDEELPEDLSETAITLTAKDEYGGYTNIALVEIYNGKLNKESEIVIPTDIYAALYNDGTLVLSNNSEAIDMTQVKTLYGNIVEIENFTLEYNYDIKKANILNKIVPKDYLKCFYELCDLTEIVNINNLDTRYITNMSYMFYRCGKLHIDVSNFDTSKVTSMNHMFSNGYFDDFWGVAGVTGLGNLDTSNVTEMTGMFFDATLTQENLNDILSMCIKATKITENKTLKNIGVKQFYSDAVQSLPNYQAFLDAGWTTGY